MILIICPTPYWFGLSLSKDKYSLHLLTSISKVVGNAGMFVDIKYHVKFSALTFNKPYGAMFQHGVQLYCVTATKEGRQPVSSHKIREPF